jgi:hypothetical protein
MMECIGRDRGCKVVMLASRTKNVTANDTHYHTPIRSSRYFIVVVGVGGCNTHSLIFIARDS